MQVYDSDTDVIVRQRKGCSRNLERILYDIKFDDYIVGTLKIDSLSADDEVLLHILGVDSISLLQSTIMLVMTSISL